MKKKKKKRTSVLFSRIQEKNKRFIERQMKARNYSEKTGKSEFVDDVFSALRVSLHRKGEAQALLSELN